MGAATRFIPSSKQRYCNFRSICAALLCHVMAAAVLYIIVSTRGLLQRAHEKSNLGDHIINEPAVATISLRERPTLLGPNENNLTTTDDEHHKEEGSIPLIEEQQAEIGVPSSNTEGATTQIPALPPMIVREATNMMQELARNRTDETSSAFLNKNDESTNSTGFRPIWAANITWWVREDTTMNCYLDSDWEFLGHGGTHWAFVTNYSCRGEESSTTDDAPSSSWSPPRQVVVRLATTMDPQQAEIAREARKRPTRYFSSISERVLEDGRVFGSQLRGGNWSNEQIDRHFCLQKGVVDIPPTSFSDPEFPLSKPLNKKALPDLFATYMAEGRIVRAELSDYARGSHVLWNLKNSHYLTRPRRLRVIQDLVKIYRYMYYQGVVHCDMHLGHAQVVRHDDDDDAGGTRSTNDPSELLHVQLVDFERVMINTNKTTGQVNQHGKVAYGQLWQLVASIASVCSHPDRAKPGDAQEGSTMICQLKRKWPPPELESQVVPDLENCPFVQPLNWTRGMFDNIPEAYERLSKLVGIKE